MTAHDCLYSIITKQLLTCDLTDLRVTDIHRQARLQSAVAGGKDVMNDDGVKTATGEHAES